MESDQVIIKNRLSQAGVDLTAIQQIVRTGHPEDQIRALLQQFGALRCQDLAYLCQVNTNTISRVARTLQDQGLVREELLTPPGQRRMNWFVWFAYATPEPDHLNALTQLVPLLYESLHHNTSDAAQIESTALVDTTISADDVAIRDRSSHSMVEETSLHVRTSPPAKQSEVDCIKHHSVSIDRQDARNYQCERPSSSLTTQDVACSRQDVPLSSSLPPKAISSCELRHVLRREGIPPMQPNRQIDKQSQIGILNQRTALFQQVLPNKSMVVSRQQQLLFMGIAVIICLFLLLTYFLFPLIQVNMFMATVM